MRSGSEDGGKPKRRSRDFIRNRVNALMVLLALALCWCTALMTEGDVRECSHVIHADLLLSTPGPFLHSAMVPRSVIRESGIFGIYT